MAIGRPLQSLRSWSGSILHPPKYVQASLIVAAGGLLNGLDTGCIGPITVMPSFEASFGTLSSLMHGVVISSVLASAAVASGFSGLLSDSLGRTSAIGIGGLVFALGAALEAGAMSLVMLILGRLIVGVGEGLFISTLVVYVCEIAPPQKRGPLACTVQVLITVGLCSGYFMCYGTVLLESTISWRLPLAIQSTIALFLGLACFLYIPESPRWLTFKGRKDEASAIWDRLGVSGAEREKDALQAAPPVTQSEAMQPFQTSLDRVAKKIRPITSIKIIFKNGGGKPMILGTFMMCMQQLSGIDGVLYYAPLLFQQAGLTSTEASFLASGVSAILICAATIPAFLLVDHWSRRASTIYGGLALFTCMITIGSLYASNSVHASHGAGRWIVIVTIYVFAVSYCVSWGLGIKLFASEIQPMATRATATSIAQSGNCISNFFVAFITPVLLSKSTSGIYFLFGGATLLTVIVCAIFMPETRGRDLEQIAETFRQQSGSTRVISDKFRKFTPRSLRSLRHTGFAELGPVGGTSAFEMGGRNASA